MRLGFLIAVLPTTVLANEPCDDHWFVRNQIFDQAGYCFGSPLGQAIFDNADCTTKAPVLTQAQQAKIDAVKEAEIEWQCSVDTTRTTLNLGNLDLRRKLTTQPMRDDTESGCIGYFGPRAPIHAGPDASSAVVGYLEPGQTFTNEHVAFEGDNPEGWSFLSLMMDDFGNTRAETGWLAPGTWDHCTHVAG